MQQYTVGRGQPISQTDVTHLLLNGGKLTVDQQQHVTFLNQYSNAIARKEKLFVVEKKTPVFRLFVDFDFQPPPSEDIIQASLQSFVGLSGLWFDQPSEAVVLRKTVDSTKKIGVHLTWDAIFVTAPIAMTFRTHVVNKLMEACTTVDWNAVVDQAVYGGSGLRMPWSYKRDAPGVYVPTATIQQDGTITPIPEIPTQASDIRTWIHRTAIRSYETVTATCITQTTIHPDRAQQPHTGSAVPVHMENYKLHLLKHVLPSPYSDDPTFQFTTMSKFGDTCFVLRSNSKKCGNKDNYKEHTTSTVYFVVVKRENHTIVYQKCFSRKDVDQEIPCVSYVGPYTHVPQDVVDMLWPPETVQKIKSTDRLRTLLSKTRLTKTTKKKKR